LEENYYFWGRQKRHPLLVIVIIISHIIRYIVFFSFFPLNFPIVAGFFYCLSLKNLIPSLPSEGRGKEAEEEKGSFFLNRLFFSGDIFVLSHPSIDFKKRGKKKQRVARLLLRPARAPHKSFKKKATPKKGRKERKGRETKKIITQVIAKTLKNSNFERKSVLAGEIEAFGNF
jgi:hypothetical protein